jgi:hypothetical protein
MDLAMVGRVVHSLLILDEPQDEVALLEGASADSAAMIVMEPLMVDHHARAS